MIATDDIRWLSMPNTGCVGLPPLPAPVERVLHLINGEFYSGAERVQDLLASRLPEFGFEVGFASVKSGQFGQVRMARKVPLYQIPMRSRLDLRAALSLVHLIRSRGYRLIHAHTPRTVLLGRIASQLTGMPLVYHVHSPALRESTRRLRNRLNGLVERWSLQAAVRLITVSRSLNREMKAAGAPVERVCYVPNGVPPVGTLAARPRPCGAWTLGTIALFRPRKGLEVLLCALGELNRAGPCGVRLRAVGPFESLEYEAKIKCLARRCGLDGMVHWTGFTRNVSCELAQMDLFVLPSLFGEGMPMVVLESMAAGVPVVATQVEGVPEIVRDGRDGLLVAPGSVEALARGISRIISGRVDWHRLRQSAHRRHAERFSDRSMAEGVAKVYREVLAVA